MEGVTILASDLNLGTMSNVLAQVSIKNWHISSVLVYNTTKNISAFLKAKNKEKVFCFIFLNCKKNNKKNFHVFFLGDLTVP